MMKLLFYIDITWKIITQPMNKMRSEMKKQKSPLDTVIKLLAFMLISLFVVFVLTVLEKNATIREQKAQIANLQDTLKLYHDYIIRLEEEK